MWIQILLEFVRKGPDDTKSTVIQVKAWWGTGDKLLLELITTWFPNIDVHHQDNKFKQFKHKPYAHLFISKMFNI